MPDPVVVVGGGIVGLSTAWALMERGISDVVVLEKEDHVAAHQTGRNSGVIHSGIYYRPGSHKAVMCRSGRQRLIDFCDRLGVSYEVCGKVIVAATEDERARLDDLHARGLENGVTCRPISRQELREREPHVEGVAALQVDDAGIVDFKGVCRKLATSITDGGGEVRTSVRVVSIHRDDSARVMETTGGEVRARTLINCAGLHSDRLARMDGVDPGLQIVPFRGHYYELVESARRFCRHLIYPVPDPAYPFLGVHFTRMFDGSVECGPNALLAFAREGYGLWEFDRSDLTEVLGYPGFRRLAAAHWRQGVTEFLRAVSRRRYLVALRRLIPEIAATDLVPAPSGIRAQALLPDGSMADDFVIRRTQGAIHVCNAPSPAATAGLEIGRYLADLTLSDSDG